MHTQQLISLCVQTEAFGRSASLSACLSDYSNASNVGPPKVAICHPTNSRRLPNKIFFSQTCLPYDA